MIEQGGVRDDRWTFAVLSDLHVSAAAGLNSFSGRQAAIALDQAVASQPDFLLINGDFVDNNTPADFELANGLLRDHVPDDLPVYWTPGNHEAGLSSTGGLDAFLAATGRPNKEVFDHKGTRFILLDSHTGDMRTSDWDQVPLLHSELAKAARTPRSPASWSPSTIRCTTRPGPAPHSCPTSSRPTCSSAGWQTSGRPPANPWRSSPVTRTPQRSPAPTVCSRSPPRPWARPRTARPTRAASSAGCTSVSTGGPPGSRRDSPARRPVTGCRPSAGH
ncbi:metallophosphoesterase [Streptomyces chiangmaiensis]